MAIKKDFFVVSKHLIFNKLFLGITIGCYSDTFGGTYSVATWLLDGQIETRSEAETKSIWFTLKIIGEADNQKYLDLAGYLS